MTSVPFNPSKWRILLTSDKPTTVWMYVHSSFQADLLHKHPGISHSLKYLHQSPEGYWLGSWLTQITWPLREEVLCSEVTLQGKQSHWQNTEGRTAYPMCMCVWMHGWCVMSFPPGKSGQESSLSETPKTQTTCGKIIQSYLLAVSWNYIYITVEKVE